MFSIELDTRRFALPSEASNARQSWRERQSTLLGLSLDGKTGLGEATPLPGYSPDSWEAAHAELRALQPRALERIVAEARRPRTDTIVAALKQLNELGLHEPSARFALHTAVLNLLAKLNGVSVPTLLAHVANFNAEADSSRPMLSSSSALASPSTPPSPLRVAHLLSLGTADASPDTPTSDGSVRCYKVKLGRDLQAEVPLLERWRQTHPKPTQLRLDFNGSMPSADGDQVWARLALLEPEFVEEPCPLRALGPPRALPTPLAFDESLFGPDADAGPIDAWLASGQVAALVLKPMVHGGVLEFVRWVNKALANSVAVVISHLFDGAVAAAMYEHLARVFGSKDVAMGLGSHTGLGLWAEEARLS